MQSRVKVDQIVTVKEENDEREKRRKIDNGFIDPQKEKQKRYQAYIALAFIVLLFIYLLFSAITEMVATRIYL